MVSPIENPIARGVACIIASAIAWGIASPIVRVNAGIIASAIASNIDKVDVNGSARSTGPAVPLKLTAQNCSGVLLCQFTF